MECKTKTQPMTLDHLKTGATLEGDSGIADDHVPVWYDEAKFKRGQDFFRRHVAAIALSMHCSLVSGFSIINLLEPLVFTNQSHTAEKSFKRYVLTFYHIFMWMIGDLWDKNGKAYKSMQTVRGMHKGVAKRMRAVYTDKLYVSQYDMGLVQSGFFGAVAMYPAEFGVKCSDQELDDYVFVWRVLGYCLGIQDKYNICSGTFEETKAIVKDIERHSLIPALENPPKDFDKMADAYIDGVNKPLPFNLHSKLSILSLVWDGFGKASPYSLGFGDNMRYYVLKSMTLFMYYVPGFEKFINYLIMHSFSNRTEFLLKDRIQRDHKAYSQHSL